MLMESWPNAVIVYDGECPFCANFVRFQRLQRHVGQVDIVDARQEHPLVLEAWRRGYDLNDGMLFIWRGQIHFGADAVSSIALLSSSSGFLSKLMRLIFGHPRRTRWLYPWMRYGRLLSLKILGRTEISNGSAR